jgi:3-hydroxybutyryl-CoA dehydrogenase
VNKVVVIGGGTMGLGIAQVLVGAAVDVVVIEASPEAAVSAQKRMETAVKKAISSGHAEAQSIDALQHLETRSDLLIDQPVDLVIEAVPEDVKLKQSVLGQAQSAFPDAMLATNTSSLSIDEIAANLDDPSALVGLHFFNPVPASRLIEIVVGARTRSDVVEHARNWANRMDKVSIEVRDSPGFATSRLGLALGLEAIRMVESGVASAADIDRGMVLGYKHPIGPLELTDRVGLDVRLAISQHLEAELGQRFTPPQLLIDLVAAGHLGRKSGQGFFQWSPEGRRND